MFVPMFVIMALIVVFGPFGMAFLVAGGFLVLMVFAGRDGAGEHQGEQGGIKNVLFHGFSPKAGAVHGRLGRDSVAAIADMFLTGRYLTFDSPRAQVSVWPEAFSQSIQACHSSPFSSVAVI